MSTQNRISAKVMLAVASFAISPAAWALGLGDAQVESYLNQPLKARIDLVSREGDDLASVTAKLASADDYQLIGASLEDIPVPVRFTVEDIEGDAYLMATSSLPVGNPVVRLIVEVNWSSGRMLREYTLFLDPPSLADQAPPPRIDNRSKPPALVPEPAPEPAPPAMSPSEAEPEPATAEPRPARPEPVSERAPDSGEYGPVASGETLWGIARDWSRGTGMSINQVMIAIQRENPDAFLNNNINLLKRGAILRMPAVSAVENIPDAVAYNEVVAQEEAFTGRQASTMAASPSMPLLSDASAAPPADSVEEEPEPSSYAQAAEALAADAGQEAEEEAATDVEAESQAAVEEATAEPEMVEGSLELVPPSEASELDSTYGFEETEDNGDAAMAAQALRENLARAEEDLITQQQQNQYLEERIKELEAQLAENEEANVADSDMANMEQRLREERQAAAAEQQDKPWYSGFGGWLIGLLLAIAALVGWRLSRRGGTAAGAGETIQEITGEAEEVLRVLEDEVEESQETADEAKAEDSAAKEKAEVAKEPEAEPKEKKKKGKKAKPAFGGSDDDAEVLDEESSDPEIQLDLARAYISMGDREAARVILEEVVSNGSEEQQKEARKMLDLM